MSRKEVNMKENGKFKWYLSWWFMLVLFVPTIGIGTMIIAGARIYLLAKKGDINPKRICVASIYFLLGFAMCKFMLTPNDDIVVETESGNIETITENPSKDTPKPTAVPTQEPTSTPVITNTPVPTKKPTSTPVPTPTPKKYSDDEIFDAMMNGDNKKCVDISEADTYRVMFDALKTIVNDGAKTAILTEGPSAYLKMYANKNTNHTKTMRSLKRLGTKVRNIIRNLPDDEDWVNEVKPFCTNYDMYNVYTGTDVLWKYLTVWGREFEHGYHSWIDGNDVLICSVKPLTKQGRQNMFLISTGKKYSYDSGDGYELKLPIYIAIDRDEVDTYEEEAGDMNIDQMKHDEERAYNNIKKILGV